MLCSAFRLSANDTAILGLYLRLTVVVVPPDLASIGVPPQSRESHDGHDSERTSSVCVDREDESCGRLPQQQQQQPQHHYSPSLRSSYLAARDYIDTFCLWTDVVVLLVGLEALQTLPVPRSGE